MKHFEDAQGYQSEIWMLVPGYGVMGELLQAWIRGLVAPGVVGVVGPGPGLELVAMAEAMPNSAFEAWEPSPQMASACAQLLAHAKLEERVTLHSRSLAMGDGRWDAAVCLLVGHLLPHRLRPAFWCSLASQLKPGGRLLFSEITAASSAQTKLWSGCAHGRGLPMVKQLRLRERLAGGFAVAAPEQTEAWAQEAGFQKTTFLADVLGLRVWEFGR